jgi:RimJ/RimL family protein N-acetyltransferase
MSDVNVRRATPDDIEGMIDVYEAVAAEGRWIGGEVPIDRERQRAGRLERIASPDGVAFLAEADGAIIGDLGMEVRGGRAELGMAILQPWRGRGVGSALMEAAIAWARARDLDKIALQVWPHNDAAIALYERFGFEREGYLRRHYRRRNGEAWDAIQMGLILHDG